MKSLMGRGRKIGSISDKEMILILVLALVCTIYGMVNYLLLPKYNECKIAGDQLNISKKNCETLRAEYKNINNLKKDESNLKQQLIKSIGQLPPYISQEDIILTLSKYAKDKNIIIKSIALEDEKRVIADNFIKNVKEAENDDLNKKEQSNGEQNNPTGSENTNNVQQPVIYIKYANISFEGKVSALYEFIDSLEKNPQKISVKEITLNKSGDVLLAGNMKLQYLAYKDKSSADNFKYDFQIPNTNGKINPFTSSSDKTEYIIPKTKNPNFNLNIKTYDNNGPKVILSEYNKPETEIYSNLSGCTKGKISISKQGEKYVYTCSLGNFSKKIKDGLNISDGIIRMKVNSHKRISEKDDIKVIMDIENNTEQVFEVVVVNDDDKALFNIGDKIGKVNIKQVTE